MPEIPEGLPEGMFVVDGRLVVNVELELDDPKPSSTGKSSIAFSTHGFVKPDFQSPVSVSINAIVKE